MKYAYFKRAVIRGAVIGMAVASLALVGCQKMSDPVTSTVSPAPINASTDVSTSQIVVTNACVPLLAGQTINVGQVCSEVVGSDLVVTYAVTPGNGWSLTEYHLWAGIKLEDMPQNSQGQPQPGQFPYKATGLDANTTTVVVRIPLIALGYDPAKVCGASAIIVSHAVVKNGKKETAYGAGTRILPKGNWGTFQTISFSGNCSVCPVFQHNAGGLSYWSPVYDIVGQYANHGPVWYPGVTITPGTCVNTVVDADNHPVLPAGLNLDPNTCIIFGIPTTPTPDQGPPTPIYYKVNAQSNCGAVGAVIQIFVAPAP